MTAFGALRGLVHAAALLRPGARHALLGAVSLALAAIPLASPLLLGLGLILAGVLVAWRLGPEMPAGDEGEVFRHYL